VKNNYTGKYPGINPVRRVNTGLFFYREDTKIIKYLIKKTIKNMKILKIEKIMLLTANST